MRYYSISILENITSASTKQLKKVLYQYIGLNPAIKVLVEIYYEKASMAAAIYHYKNNLFFVGIFINPLKPFRRELVNTDKFLFSLLESDISNKIRTNRFGKNKLLVLHPKISNSVVKINNLYPINNFYEKRVVTHITALCSKNNFQDILHNYHNLVEIVERGLSEHSKNLTYTLSSQHLQTLNACLHLLGT